jgi:hypothetical protein
MSKVRLVVGCEDPQASSEFFLNIWTVYGQNVGKWRGCVWEYVPWPVLDSRYECSLLIEPDYELSID